MNLKLFNHIMANLLCLALSLSALTVAWASGTKVGNGNDGADLEKRQRVKSGILIESRDKAMAKLKSLNVNGIEHLGNLINEIEKSEIYLVSENKKAQHKFDRGMESSPDNNFVYARTFARPYAATRFFPAALMLSENQLIALHVHEGLHRALPPQVRENEEVVSKVTLSLTTPGATHDQVRQVVASNVTPYTRPAKMASATQSSFLKQEDIKLEKPNTVSYGFKVFNPDPSSGFKAIDSLHSVKSYMHPFGRGNEAIGIGIELSYLKGEEQSYMGPLGISGRMKLWTVRGFDVSAWGMASLTTLAEDEIDPSPMEADGVTLGLVARKEGKHFYIENSLGLTGERETEERLGHFVYKHEFGQVITAKVAAGTRIGEVDLGGFAELSLADPYKTTGPGLEGIPDSGRYRILSVGPDVGINFGDLKWSFEGKYIIDSTPGFSLDYLGNLLGMGSGQGYAGSSLSYTF